MWWRNCPEAPEIWKRLLCRAPGSVSELQCDPEQAAAGAQLQPCRAWGADKTYLLDMEPGSGQSLVAPHYPSLAARRCRSSPDQSWGHQAAPGVSTADAHPGLGSHQHPPDAVDLVSSCWGRSHLHHLQHPHTFARAWGSL